MNKIKPPISDKTAVREEIKKRLSVLSEQEKMAESQNICEQLLRLPNIQEAEAIILYQCLVDEVSLEYLIKQLRKEEKNIITIDTSGNYPSLPKEGIVLIPGRAFTLSGKRIGRGGGWYDTFLAKNPRLFTIGVCFGCQIFPELPQDEWDVGMRMVIIPVHTLANNYCD